MVEYFTATDVEKWKALSRVQLFATPWTVQNSPGQNTGVGSLSLLQGIFATQGLNPGLLYCRQILYQLSYKGSPRILEWVAFPFSSGSSWLRNKTGVSYIAGGFFTNWAIREAHRCGNWGGEGPGHRYTYGWFMLLFGSNQHNTVKQLSFN